MFNRRHFLGAALGGSAVAAIPGLLPAWARSSTAGNLGIPSLTGTEFNLDIGTFPVRIDGRAGLATGVNGTLPGPLLRFREGEDITINVRNGLKAATSIHWHGLLVPFYMDGVPGVSFPGIPAGERFQYRFSVPQSGTYWYHSHSGLQEQAGHYGPLLIDPSGSDPVRSDREYVLLLSDWSFETPHRIFEKLKASSETYNFNQRTLGDFASDAARDGLGRTLGERAMWGAMRMSPRDIADVTGATYTYLINGHATADNWNAVFQPGERVRLRIINGSAMSIFNFRIPGLSMQVVAADGLNVQPVETDEFQIGTAETYDVIVQPEAARAFAMVAESIDRSGQVIATLGPEAGMRADIPAMRAVPTLGMKDMAMDHGAMNHGSMELGPAGGTGMSGMDHSGHTMDGMDHAAMGHDVQMSMPDMNHSSQDRSSGDGISRMTGHKHETGPGVANVAAMPTSRLDEPGLGLENVGHRVLTYADLRALTPNPDTRPPERTLDIHLTSNMERYMWSFDGVKFSEVRESIRVQEGERVRFNLVNDTMMPHPIHLHGMYFELENGGGSHRPRKHTVIVKPGEKVAFDISSEHVGDWAFHCHLLYHMHAGMMNVVSVIPHEGPHDGPHDGKGRPMPASEDPHANHHNMDGVPRHDMSPDKDHGGHH